MMLHIRTAAPAAALAVAALSLAAPSHAQEVIYDSLSPILRGLWLIHEHGEEHSSAELPGGFENESQAGNRVVFGGSARHLTEVAIRLRGLGDQWDDTSLDVTLRLWQADGETPGALLWSGTQRVTLPWGAPAVADVVFSPNITVPDTLVWTFAFDNIVDPFGVPNLFGAGVHSEDPAIGSTSGAAVWQDSTTLAWHVDAGPFPQNLEARFTAIPAPSAGALGIALALAAARRRR